MREQPLPYRWHAGRQRDMLARDQFVKRFAVQRRAREHQFGAHHAGDIRQAPRVHMEHWHDRQDHVARGAVVQRVGQRGRVGVQQRRAVAIEDPLRVAGGARRVAQRGGAVLIQQGPFERAIVAVHEVLVAHQHRGQAMALRHVRAIGHRDINLGALDARGDALDERKERQVEDTTRSSACSMM
jgi:hypothetical protein